VSNPTEDLVLSPLSTTIVGSRSFVYESIGSTNDRALEVGGDGTVIVADTQSSGRGRRGRAWHSASGLGLWFSVALQHGTEGLAFAAPLAVRDAVRGLCDVRVKWPNDVLIDGRKFCGVLVERRGDVSVIGIGINVKHTAEDFPSDLRDQATSLERATGQTIDRGDILRRVLTALDERVIVIRAGGIDSVREAWAEACAIRGRVIHSDGKEGTVHEVDHDGGLLVDTKDGEIKILFGEIVEVDG
jgi:BirA family biotin operon repressor/biotin-[acetyl-CoA-carboxylase] ligase